jgi:uncharacterized protein YhbP (UPF0306 family)
MMRTRSVGRAMSNQDYPFWDLLRGESVLTLATADACGSWSAPVLYAASLLETQPVLYFLSSVTSRHIKNLPLNASAAGSIYASYQGDWQAIQGLQMHGAIVEVDLQEQNLWQSTYFARFPEVANMIDSPSSEKEQKIAKAFEKSGKYRFTPRFIRVTDNSNQFASKNEWTFD